MCLHYAIFIYKLKKKHFLQEIYIFVCSMQHSVKSVNVALFLL